MNNQNRTRSLSHARGITLVEILLVISLLAIILSFAIPSMSGTAAKADMMAAVENVEYSLDSARNSARLNEQGIAVDFKTYAGDPSQVITFHRVKSGAAARIPEYRLAENIELVSDQEFFVFDERGLVENPGTITLISKVDESISVAVEVN